MNSRRPDVVAAARSGQPTGATVLLVEDSAADAELARLALADTPVVGSLHVARTGGEALRFLRRQAEYGAAPVPDLVLLDLDLPGVDGREVLAEVRADPRLCGIPVVVLTSSADPMDVVAAYRAGANCYVTKPFTLDEYLGKLQALARYWLTTARLPGRSGPLSSGP